MVKTFKIIFSRTKGPVTLVCSIGDLGPTKFVQMMTLGWPWSFLQQGQMCFFMLLYGKIYISSGKILESHLMAETYNKWPVWQKVYVDIKILTPNGLSAPARGLYTSIKAWKICIKSGCLLLPWGYIHTVQRVLSKHLRDNWNELA